MSVAARRRRSWLFVAGADESAHAAAARSRADVIILELEDFTPPELRPRARALAEGALGRWRRAGAVAGVRINPLETCGREDLHGIIAARPDVILMSKVDTPAQVERWNTRPAAWSSSCRTSNPPQACATPTTSPARARA